MTAPDKSPGLLEAVEQLLPRDLGFSGGQATITACYADVVAIWDAVARAKAQPAGELADWQIDEIESAALEVVEAGRNQGSSGNSDLDREPEHMASEFLRAKVREHCRPASERSELESLLRVLDSEERPERFKDGVDLVAKMIRRRLASQPEQARPSRADGTIRAEPGEGHALAELMQHDKADLARLILRMESERDQPKPDPEPGDEIEAWLEKATEHDDSESDDYPDEWFRVEGRAIDEAVEIMRRYRDLAWTAERSREEASKQRDEALQRVRELEASGNTPGDMQLANDRVKVLEDEVEELRQRADERPALRELREWLVAAWSELIEAKKKHDPGSELRVIAQAQANDIQGVIAKVDELLAKQEAGDG